MTPNPALPDPRRTRGARPLLAGILVAAALAANPPAAGAARWTWSGSLTLDHMSLLNAPREEALAPEGAVVEWSLKTTVEVSERLTVETRVCTSCHGLAVDQAYAEVRLHPRLGVEAGRINVPFGDFTLRHDPANDVFLTKPLPYAMGRMLRYQQNRFNLGVVPMPYVDHGATLFGDVWIRDALQIWYGLYAVNGFRASAGRDFNFIAQTSDAGLQDNNRDLSWGGRLALGQGPYTVGGSYLRGAYDPAAEFTYEAWGVDASVHVRGVQLRAEYLERATDVEEQGGRRILRKKGFYAQLEAPLHRHLAVVGRLDGLLREGARLGTDNDESSGIVRWSLGLNVKPAIDYGFRVQYERWRFTDFADADALHVGVVATY